METETIENLIQTRLSTLAGQSNISILYACESGSRAWGFASTDSDYDVRFIYANPVSWYLRLLEDKDVINLPIEDTPQGILDLGGWDVRKTLRLVVKPNPVIWEWLQSPMCYQAGPLFDIGRIRKLIDPFYSPITACHHYLSICRNTLEKELTGQTVKIKKYFYMLRPVLAANWIVKFQSIPPMEFVPLLNLLEDKPGIKHQVDNLVQLKLNTDEESPIERISLLNDFEGVHGSERSRALYDDPCVAVETGRFDEVGAQAECGVKMQGHPTRRQVIRAGSKCKARRKPVFCILSCSGTNAGRRSLS